MTALVDPADAADDDAAVVAPDVERASIQSIERASAVLGLFDQETRQLSPAIVAERLGLNRTTAHRYLQSLQKFGFLDSGYGLGPLFDQLSAFISGRQRILGFAPAVLRHLSDETGLTAVLSLLGRSGAVVTLVEEASTGTIILTVPVGAVLEVRAAQTRALLAFQSDQSVVRRAHAGLSAKESREELAELERVRRDRVAWADLGRVGLASVAAPVFGASDVQAAMGILGTTAMLTPDEPNSERVEMLREAAAQLSALVTS
jgi:DNA-binding IclR family transcriptional regulator